MSKTYGDHQMTMKLMHTKETQFYQIETLDQYELFSV